MPSEDFPEHYPSETPPRGSASRSSSHSSRHRTTSSRSDSSRASERPKERYLIRLETLREAVQHLPAPEYSSGDTYEVQLGERRIPFRKIKLKDSRGRSDQWIFDGKILVS